MFMFYRRIRFKKPMDSSDAPILRQIMLAREHARLENFDAALSAYSDIEREVETQLRSCGNPTLLEKWDSLLTDLKGEVASVLRLKEKVASILETLSQTALDYDSGNSEWSHNDDILDLPPARKLRGRDRRPQIDGVKPKAIGSSKQPPGFSVVPIKAAPRESEGSARDPVRKGGKAPANSRQAAKVQAKPVAKQPELPPRAETDLATNPLAQQIIDMGILIREPNVPWDSIAGLASVKRLLRQNLVVLPLRPDIARGLLAPWKSVLFYGPPGTGKTFLAKAVATECRRTFFNITSATISSKWHGESEKLISYTFELADQMAPSTIFFDEIDSIASQRGAGGEHEASRRMKGQLLTKLEGVDGASDNSNIFVLAATNFPWDLDEALLRRFQKRIYIPLPDVEGRLAILNMHLAELTDEDSFAFREWAERLEGYSCADVENLCKDAAQAVLDARMAKMDEESWVKMSAEEARFVIRDEDFAKAVKNRKSSVDPATLHRYDEWRSKKGAE
jgi:katanin p60 ATPase-containing subunit A1